MTDINNINTEGKGMCKAPGLEVGRFAIKRPGINNIDIKEEFDRILHALQQDGEAIGIVLPLLDMAENGVSEFGAVTVASIIVEAVQTQVKADNVERR